MKYLVIRHNTHTHCIFQELFYPCQYHDFLKEQDAERASGWTHIKTLSVIPIEDNDAHLHNSLDDHTSARWTDSNMKGE